jgi:AAA domain (dynein-related subfamily)/CbbQ/NirQ/NorQ C-terminal
MASATITKILGHMKDSGKTEFSRDEVIKLARKHDLSPEGFLASPLYRIRRGTYGANSAPAPVSGPAGPVETPLNQVMLAQPKLHVEVDNLVPAKDSTYVPFGFFKDLGVIVQSKAFYPVFISGLSGNGKTTMVEQVCAKLKREVVRVNISIETDEDDLIGGNTLVNGNVVYREGPVLLAMKRGAILILDECDRGSNKLMCLQAILEGKPYFNKKTMETIWPTPGFNIIATANTKGQGSDDGKYMSVQILDDAFLERFAITVEQEYPSPAVERRIVIKKMARADKVDEDFADKLVQWAEIIRKTYREGGAEELVSTRRLEHIVNAFAMFGDRMKAITLCISRFDPETKTSFLDLYSKIDGGVSMEDLVKENIEEEF